MEFFEEISIEGSIYVNFSELKITRQVDLDKLNYLVERKGIERYFFWKNTPLPASSFSFDPESSWGWPYYFKKSELESLGILLDAETFKPEPQTEPIQDEKMLVEAFLESHRESFIGLWKAVLKSDKKAEAKQVADDYFKHHPEFKVGQDDLPIDFFNDRKGEKAKRKVLGSIVQVILRKNFNASMGKDKIMNFLKST